MDKLYIIDGHALIFRMYYAFARHPMINSKGADMSILFGFTKYLMDYRMDMAREMMRTSDKQMKEISSLVGYDDYSQFEKLFKKENHMTPLDYRKKVRSGR